MRKSSSSSNLVSPPPSLAGRCALAASAGSGEGTALGELEAAAEYIGKKPSAHDTLVWMHRLCYGKPGVKTVRKKNLRVRLKCAPRTRISDHRSR